MYKKIFSCLIAIIFMVGTLSTTGFAATNVKFKDVSKTHSNKKAIEYVVSKKIMTGYKGSKFKPSSYVTREDAAKAIVKALKLSTKNRPNPKFTDLKKSSKAYPYAATLVDEKIWKKSKKFNPKGKITKIEMATMLTKAFKLKSVKNLSYSDVSKKNKAYKEVQAFVTTGVGKRKSSTKFGASDLVKRGAFSQYIYNGILYKKGKLKSPYKKEPVKKPEPKPEPKPLTFSEQVVNLVNVERKKIGVEPLKIDKRLEKTATLKSEDMRNLQYLSHTSPTYGSPFDMMRNYGISYYYAGENIAAGQVTPEDVMNSWMNSSGHKANMLNSRFTHIGVGYANGGPYRHYWTQQFIQVR
ncbi:CAP domain-containing protein [Viridibacillus arvi]|uniref:CAP domain-containing protein n=1 Tax=Viridibacillus arvi TaxID=263475 RepID=UPI003CFE45C7